MRLQFIPVFMGIVSRLLCILIPVFVFMPGVAGAQEAALFDPETGYRISAYRAPVPDAVPGGEVISPGALRDLMRGPVVILDVLPIKTYEINADGSWITAVKRQSIPGAVWLPIVGPGRLGPDAARYLDMALQALTGGDMARPVVVYCQLDCWMSWNAARRIAALGYTRVYWLPGGADEWEAAGFQLQQVLPYTPPGWRPEK